MSYTDPLKSRRIDDDKYQVLETYSWDIGFKGSGFTYIVPEEFIFDVSIPKIITWIFSRHDSKFLKASALHDHMLKNSFSRVEAAGTFHEALKADGVNMLKRLAMFLGVVFFKYK